MSRILTIHDTMNHDRDDRFDFEMARASPLRNLGKPLQTLGFIVP